MSSAKGIQFRVATQLTDKDDIHVRTLRVFSSETVIKFAERILGFKLDDCSFAEVHQLGERGAITIIYGDKDKDWPKNVRTVNHDCVFGMRSDAPERSSTPAVIVAPTPPTPVVPLVVVTEPFCRTVQGLFGRKLA